MMERTDFGKIFFLDVDGLSVKKTIKIKRNPEKLSYPRQSRGFISVSPSKGQKHEAPEGADSHT